MNEKYFYKIFQLFKSYKWKSQNYIDNNNTHVHTENDMHNKVYDIILYYTTTIHYIPITH
jgi:hypothetical protein